VGVMSIRRGAERMCTLVEARGIALVVVMVGSLTLARAAPYG